ADARRPGRVARRAGRPWRLHVEVHDDGRSTAHAAGNRRSRGAAGLEFARRRVPRGGAMNEPPGPPLPGIHHITAICSDPQRNVGFYAGVLGLRLVKQTVNFDDPGAYHLYYGDGLGSPGTILTFFAWVLPPTVRAAA